MTANKIPLIIHAGRHKTGTTYLQKFLGSNRKVLLNEYSILYPETGMDPHFNYHHNLFKIFEMERPTRHPAIISLFEEIEASQPRAVILSSEYLSRESVDENFLERLRNSFCDFDIKIIFYLREQSDFLCSRYAERIRRGLISYPHDIWSFDAELDYYKFLERYVNIFGRDNVSARFYESAKDNGGLLNDFTSWLGFHDVSEFDTPEMELNKRLPWPYLKLLWYANKNRLFRRLVLSSIFSGFFIVGAKTAPKIFDGGRPINNSQAESLRNEYQESNNLVTKNFTGSSPILDIKKDPVARSER